MSWGKGVSFEKIYRKNIIGGEIVRIKVIIIEILRIFIIFICEYNYKLVNIIKYK